MKITDIKGEEALDVLVDLIDPIAEISSDKAFLLLLKTSTKLEAIKYVIKNHKKSILFIMATLNKENPETYNPSIVELPAMLLDLFNDSELIKLFPSQGQGQTSSGSVSVNTEVSEQ